MNTTPTTPRFSAWHRPDPRSPWQKVGAADFATLFRAPAPVFYQNP